MTREHLIAEIEAFAKRHGIEPATVTSRLVGNSRLHHRLKDGRSCTLAVADKLLKAMAEADEAKASDAA